MLGDAPASVFFAGECRFILCVEAIRGLGIHLPEPVFDRLRVVADQLPRDRVEVECKGASAVGFGNRMKRFGRDDVRPATPTEDNTQAMPSAMVRGTITFLLSSIM